MYESPKVSGRPGIECSFIAIYYKISGRLGIEEVRTGGPVRYDLMLLKVLLQASSHSRGVSFSMRRLNNYSDQPNLIYMKDR